MDDRVKKMHDQLAKEISRNILVPPTEEVFNECEDFPEVKCKQCGCTDNNACSHPVHGNCWWVEPFLCSHCQMGLNIK